MSGPDLDALIRLSRPQDRRAAPFFVGRKTVIADIEAQLADAFADVRAGTPARGLTMLVQGAPGAGKTSLLGHLQERWKASGDAPLALELHRSTCSSIAAVVEEIAYKVGHGEVFREARQRSGEVNTGLPPVLGARGSRATITSPPPARFESLARARPGKSWPRPLCLMVDEIQNVDTDQTACLQALHDGAHGLPIVLLCAGLGNSQEMLARAGISRLASNAVYGLASLAKEEAMEAILRFLRGCRVEAAEGLAADWAEVIAERSDAWPQFVRTEMAALAGGLVTAKGMLADVDDAAVRREAERLRNASYDARLSDELRDAMNLVAAVMAEVPPEGMDSSRILAAIRRHARQDDDPPGWQQPEGMTARGLLDHMIHKGALQRREGNLLTCPIPSFRTWLIQQGDPEAWGQPIVLS